MEITKLNIVCFSATYTTKKVLEYIAEGLGDIPVQKYDITMPFANDVTFGKNELMLVGVPVYAGRIPRIAADALKHFKGQSTPAIVVCVYGNRDYDDALLELKDVVTTNGFHVISAAAFVAQHSIFPKLAEGRPDADDKLKAIDFGKKSFNLLKNLADVSTIGEVKVKGNYPYKEANPVPLFPHGNDDCNNCGTCVELCPVMAIDVDDPRKTDESKCISCGRCIVICPQNARHHDNPMYPAMVQKFFENFAEPRKEVETVFANA